MMSNISKIFVIVALLGFSVFIQGCSGDPNAEFRPAEDKAPKVPVSEGRGGDSNSFLPSDDG